MMKQSSLLVGILFLLLTTGCGPYKITYQMPSNLPAEEIELEHAHGIGIYGGGVTFFAFHRMFPCFVDWTGPIQLQECVPDGFSEIQQYHTFYQNAGAAVVSWSLYLNVYHLSTIKIIKAKVEPEKNKAKFKEKEKKRKN